jgi:hypothetical protein
MLGKVHNHDDNALSLEENRIHIRGISYALFEGLEGGHTHLSMPNSSKSV